MARYTSAGRGRSVRVGINYMAVDATKYFSSAMASFSYTDEAHSKSDVISIRADNIDGRWGNGWYPNPYDRIETSLIYSNGSGSEIVYPCGAFYVDDVTLTWPSRVIDFEAVSKPITRDFDATERSKVWSKVTLKKIAEEIAATAGVALVYDAADTGVIETIEQSKQTDSDFLTKTCDSYGKKLKVYADKIIIYDLEAYEAKESKITFMSDAVADVQWNSTAQGTYTGARLAYTIAKTKKTIDVMVGTPERLLVLNESVKTEAEALEKARAAVNEKNRSAATIAISPKTPRFIAASSVVEMLGFGGVPDGRYFVTKVTYNVSSNGFTEKIEGYKIPAMIR